MRINVAIGWWIFTLAILLIGGAALWGSLGISLGIASWLIITAFTARLFLVSVPEVTGLVTVNYFGGALRPYGTGIRFKFPWEQVKGGNFINLRIVTQEFGKDGKNVETYPSADGPEMLVKWSFQYRGHLPLLDRYIAVDETTINNGLREIGSSYLSATIGTLNAEEVRGGPIDPITGKPTMDREEWRSKLEEDFRDHFEKRKHKMVIDGIEREGTLEELYGIDILVVSLSDIDFSARYQGARETAQISNRLKEAAEGLRTRKITREDGTIVDELDPSMTGNDAFNHVLIIDGKVKKSIQGVEGTGAQAAVATLMSIFGGANRERS